MENLTILVNTCDKYDDCWQPFFQLFDKFGDELKKCKIYLNTETKTFSYDGLNIICPQLYKKGEKVEWGKRLRDTLKLIDTEYVLFLLDDFFLQKKVDSNKIVTILNYLKNNTNIACFNLECLNGAINPNEKYKGFSSVESNVNYRFNAQACIWKKSSLYNSILDIESPWAWEIYGNMRNNIISKEEVYCLNVGEVEPYFYNFYSFNKKDKQGRYICQSAIRGGKWAKEVVEKCFAENKINVDFNIRGIIKQSNKNKFKQTKLFEFIRVASKPFRKKSIEKKLKEEEGKINLYVTPYINKEK